MSAQNSQTKEAKVIAQKIFDLSIRLNLEIKRDIISEETLNQMQKELHELKNNRPFQPNMKIAVK